MDKTNHNQVPDGKDEQIDTIAARRATPPIRPGSHAAWLRSQSDDQLRLVVQVLSRHQGLYRI